VEIEASTQEAVLAEGLRALAELHGHLELRARRPPGRDGAILGHRGVAEEVPFAYKTSSAWWWSSSGPGLAARVAQLVPIGVVKG